MKKPALLGLLALTSLATSANAYEFRARWVVQTGPGLFDFTVLPNNTITLYLPDRPIRYRLQLGVFDDANGPAPAGGLIGWNFGTLTDSEPAEGTNSRTPGRLAPYTFAPASGGANGLPEADPWVALTGIDNTLGTQTQSWPDGQPAPNPPIIRGRNTFASVYEITSVATGSGLNYDITASGNGLAASSWNIIQQDPPPGDGSPGSVLYGPAAAPPVPFTCVLHIIGIPAPTAAALLGLAGLIASRRRRS